MKEINIRGKRFLSPIFLPDATKGFIKCVSTEDIKKAQIEGLVVNAYHLFNEGIIKEVHKKGGIHKYMDFRGLIISDSGGFQVMSLIRDNKDLGYIDDDKAVFTVNGKRVELTPELCIKIQIIIGADIVMCLDDCTQPDLPYEEQKKSVERTIKWAERCKKEFERLTNGFENKPLIFGIIQGGKNLELRKKCADELKKIGFDGYAFGGWPAEKNEFLSELLEYTARLMPDDKIKYAMGVGKPENVAECFFMGYDLFDCVIPTREARNERMYVFKKGWFGMKKPSGKSNFYKKVRIRNKEHANKKKPLSEYCEMECCKKFSAAEIREMFKDKNPEAKRVATIHNLRFYSKLTEMLKLKLRK
jgi:queuine tRNA-ribosyltransferase